VHNLLQSARIWGYSVNNGGCMNDSEGNLNKVGIILFHNTQLLIRIGQFTCQHKARKQMYSTKGI
jgi:hypothetical protein